MRVFISIEATRKIGRSEHVASPRRRTPKTLAIVVAMLSNAALASACGEIGAEGLSQPEAAPNQVSSDHTRVRITNELPLAIEILSGDDVVGLLGLPGDDAPLPTRCNAFSVGIRPPSDDGERYHDVENPADDIEWFVPDRVTRADLDDGAPDGSIALELSFSSPQSSREFLGHVVFSPRPDAFVDVDASFDLNEGDVAMLQSCFRVLDVEAAHVVGGGQRFDGVDLVGRVIPLAFRAPSPTASGTNESHAPIPFFATAHGLGVLVETERVGAFDVGATDATKIFARFHGTSLPLRLRASSSAILREASADDAPGASPDASASGPNASLYTSVVVDNVAAHNRRMGLPPMLPAWALAPQQWRNENDVTVQDGVVVESGRDRLMADLNKMRSLKIPGALVWIDAPWSTGFNSFEFNPAQFPAAQEMLNEVQDRGYHVIVWATEHINRSDDSATLFGMPVFATLDDYQRFDERGYFVKNTNGSTFNLPWGRGTGGYVDFTHPQAVAAWQERLRPLVQMGVRGFKLDYGESMRADLLGLGPNDTVSFADGTTTRVQHTRYQRLYHEAFLQVLRQEWGEDYFVITRTGGIFDQRNGVTLWPGDLDNDFGLGGEIDDDGVPAVGGLRAAISGGLSAAMSGYPFYGSDIGGYRGGPPSTEVLIRWAQFGALSPVMQLGGGGTGDQTHNPWDEALYDTAVAVPAYQKMARLHMRLLPYLRSILKEAVTTGMPVMVPAGAVVVDDSLAWEDGNSYFFGDSLFVAPVTTAGAVTRSLRLPPGFWIDFENGSLFEGPATVVVDAPLDTLPLWVRAGAIVPLLDPRVDTVIAARGDGDGGDGGDEDIVDSGGLDPVVVLRTSAGPAHASVLYDDTVLTQVTADDVVVVTVTGAVEKRWVSELWLREERGPTSTSTVNGMAAGDSQVQTFEELLTCAPPCHYRGPTSIAVAQMGTSITAVFE